MTESLIVVKAAHDAEAGVWFVESSDMPGLRLEAKTLERLAAKLPGAIRDLLEEGAPGRRRAAGRVTPVELIAHLTTRVHHSGA